MSYISASYMTEKKKYTVGTHQKNTYIGLMSLCMKYMVFSLSLGQK